MKTYMEKQQLSSTVYVHFMMYVHQWKYSKITKHLSTYFKKEKV